MKVIKANSICSDIAITSDGVYVAYQCDNLIIYMYDTIKNNIYKTFSIKDALGLRDKDLNEYIDRWNIIKISSNDKYIIWTTYCVNKHILIWDIHTGKYIKFILNHVSSPLLCIEMSPDNEHILVGFEYSIVICNIKTGKFRILCNTIGASHIAFSKSNEYIATSYYNNKEIIIWNMNEIVTNGGGCVGEKCIFKRIIQDNIREQYSCNTLILFTTDSKFIVSFKNNITYFNVHTGNDIGNTVLEEEVKTISEEKNYGLNDVKLTPDDKYIIELYRWDTVVIYDTTTCKCVKKYKYDAEEIESFMLSPNGKYLILHNDKEIRILPIEL